MIIVTGATGHLGRGIVDHLLTRVGPDEVGVSVRDPDRAADLAERGVRVRRGDFGEPGSLPHAIEGARLLLVVSSNAAAYGGDPLAQHRAVIGAAVDAGVERVVYTSHQGAGAESAFPPCRDHAATETMLAESGLAWTALRHGFYASTALGVLGDPVPEVVTTPASGPVAWTTTDDLAVGDAEVLLRLRDDEPGWDGPTAPLTAAEALSPTDLARLASQVLGREVRHEVEDDDEALARLTSRGLPPGAAAMVVAIHQAARAGDLAATDPTLERLLGRPPTSVRDLLVAAG
ncbi:NAD(P)H-binding protein [Nocardioides marinquilinus]|uniref:NAD(P)H-binding protein n=1 Tax=Nocardioides marinquilinus TaxID=1210400 RepID=A0ABP9PAK5_9ACTN